MHSAWVAGAARAQKRPTSLAISSLGRSRAPLLCLFPLRLFNLPQRLLATDAVHQRLRKMPRRRKRLSKLSRARISPHRPIQHNAVRRMLAQFAIEPDRCLHRLPVRADLCPIQLAFQFIDRRPKCHPALLALCQSRPPRHRQQRTQEQREPQPMRLRDHPRPLSARRADRLQRLRRRIVAQLGSRAENNNEPATQRSPARPSAGAAMPPSLAQIIHAIGA
jgi:hypothetical protein